MFSSKCGAGLSGILRRDDNLTLWPSDIALCCIYKNVTTFID